MKNILIGLVAIVAVFFGYSYFNSAKLPQECFDAKNTYFEAVNRLKSVNTDGSLTSSIDMLTTLGEKLDAVMDPNKRYKRNKIDEIRAMCIKNKTLAENAIQQLDSLK